MIDECLAGCVVKNACKIPVGIICSHDEQTSALPRAAVVAVGNSSLVGAPGLAIRGLGVAACDASLLLVWHERGTSCLDLLAIGVDNAAVGVCGADGARRGC